MAELKVKVSKDKAPKKEKDIQYFLNNKTLKVFVGSKDAADIRSKLSDADWKDIAEDSISIDAAGFDQDAQEMIYDIVRLKSIKFNNYQTEDGKKGRKSKETKSPKVKLNTKNAQLKSKLSEREKLCSAVEFCRTIVESNASEINPGEMERQAKLIAKASAKITVKVIDASQAKKLGMGCLLAVGAESIVNNPKDFHPRLVVLEYDPGKSNAEHLALVGKGITFDTGGLCLKPTQYMLDMKSDMAGSALVLSVFKAIADMKLKLNCKVTGVLALAENGFGNASYKPGDVLSAMNGKTVQVVDTDAEGRLVLADALSYVSAKTKPDMVFDFATLTGSIVATLGEVASGVMTNDRSLLNKVEKSFSNEGEKIWEMPLYDEYKINLESEIADLAHCRGRPDAIVAGLFLREFVGVEDKKIPWIHFDIAGTGYIEADGLFAYKGATGYGVKSIIHYLRSF